MELYINTFMLGMLVACFTIFFEACMSRGYILRKYKNFITINLWYGKTYISGVRFWNKLPFRQSLYKVLGGCTYCSNFWQNFLFFCVISSSDIVQSPYFLVLFLQAGFSHVLLRLWFFYAER